MSKEEQEFAAIGCCSKAAAPAVHNMTSNANSNTPLTGRARNFEKHYRKHVADMYEFAFI